MRLKCFIALLLSTAMISASAPLSLAEDSRGDEIKVILNGTTLSFERSPFIVNDTTMVPMRVIFEKLGAAVAYDEYDKMIAAVKGSSTVILFADNTEAYINEDMFLLDAAPVIIEGTTFVPIRFVCEALKCSVEWDGDTKTINIVSGANRPAFVPNDEPERFVEIPCTADSFIKNGTSSSSNFGSDQLLEYKASNEDNYCRKVLLKFDASQLTDANITNAYVKLYCDDGEDLSQRTAVTVYEISDNWSETGVTFDNAPAEGAEAGNGYVIDKGWHELDITGYMRDQVDMGVKTISLMLYDMKQGNKRLNFYSRENTNPPVISVKYGGEEVIPPTQEPLPDFDKDPLEQAREVLERSRAVYTKAEVSENGYIKVSDDELDFLPVADAFIRNDEHADSNFGKDSVLCSKNAGTDKGMSRRIFMTFDLSGLHETTVGGAFLKMKVTQLQDAVAQKSTVTKVADTSWDETAITWNNAPADSGKQGSVTITENGSNVYYDLTSFINSEIKSGGKKLSICVSDLDNQNVRLEFGSRESNNPPRLMIMSPGAAGGTVEVPGANASTADPKVKYIEVGVNKNKQPFTQYTKEKTRILSSLTDYKEVKTKPEVTVYGGLKSTQEDATGYFYTRKIDDRWWMIDPEGHRMINIGLVAVSPGSSDREVAGLKKYYGDQANWANKFTKYLREDLGFNGAGAWSTVDLMRGAEQPFPYTSMYNMIVAYADELGTSVQQSGHKGFVNNTMPVFDPGFEIFCDKFAQRFEVFKDDPYLIGYFSDNELPCNDDMLDNYLKLDPNDELNKYSYTTAWEWMKQRHGENATINDIGGADRDDWREFVYDRYFDICHAAIRKYDPNHMYLGSRFWNNAKTSQGMWRAAGRYCDVVSLNYYSAWSPSQNSMKDWEEWSGKPLLVTEWYTKGMDSGLGNTSGAGWIVATQKERGYFYQNFAMGLLESGTCVGWHWFKYHDNDPTAPASDPSNVDGNKGIITPDFNEYTDLTDQMRIFNKNVYGLIEYFDSKKSK